MKIAIIGAGLSGLSCALELEKHGIKPVIFEKQNYIGEALGFASLWPNILIDTKTDPLKYLRQKYNLHLKSISNFRKLIIKSESNKTTIKANLGYIFKRGMEKYSLENQIASKISSPIFFDTFVEIDAIKHEYDSIIVSTANSTISNQLGVWKNSYFSQIRHSIVLGEFQPNTAFLYLNSNYCKNSYGALIPINKKEASIMLVVNDIPLKELDHYWQKFLSMENLNYPIIEIRDLTHNCGIVNQVNINNFYLTGCAGGFTDNFMGTGGFRAIETGILAARSIIKNLNYNKTTQKLREEILNLNEIRKIYNTYDNKALDRLLSIIKFPLIKQSIYNNPFFKISMLSKFQCKAKRS